MVATGMKKNFVNVAVYANPDKASGVQITARFFQI